MITFLVTCPTHEWDYVRALQIEIRTYNLVTKKEKDQSIRKSNKIPNSK